MDVLDFPRLFELIRSGPESSSEDFYFRNIHRLIENESVKQKYRDLEKELELLDFQSWEILKTEVIPLLNKRDKLRGWQALFDLLNSTKAHSWLKNLNCTNIRLIPRSKHQRTPDIEAHLDSKRILCEVKTINISNEEASARAYLEVREISTWLKPGFFEKLHHDIIDARSQLEEYDPSKKSRWIVFVVVNYDDFFKTFETKYLNQIRQYLADNPISDVDAVVDT